MNAKQKVYEQRLDLYYIGSIGYLITLILYALVAGSISDEGFRVVLRDPIIYLLALVCLVSLVALVVAVILRKRIVIEESALVFSTRFKERRITPEQIESLRFTRGARGKIRQGQAEPAARMKLRDRRRRLWIRPSGFATGEDLIRDLKTWATENNIPSRQRKRRSRTEP